MRRAASPRLTAYSVLAGVGLIAALALRRPELTVLVAPFALVLAAGLRDAGAPGVEASFSLDDERVIEGEETGATIVVRTDAAIDRLELLLVLPTGAETVGGGGAVALRLAAGEERELRVRLRCARWGLYDVGALELRARSFLRIVMWEKSLKRTQRLKAYPRADTLREIVPPLETQVFTGSEVAEAAIAVVDELQGKGLGRALLERLVAAARERGVTKFRAEVLSDNAPMLSLLRQAGDAVEIGDDPGVVAVELPLPEPTPAPTGGLIAEILRQVAQGLLRIRTRFPHR